MITTQRLAILFLFLMLCPLHIPTLSPSKAIAALAESGTVSGTVTENAFGNFTLSHDGASSKFLTGRETSYEPDDFRPQTGDKVSVTYITKQTRSGEAALVATLLKLTAINPDRKEVKSPTNGQIDEVGRKMIRINLIAEKTTMGFEIQRSTEYVPSDWKPAASDNVTVHFSRIPSRFGKTYVYVIDKIEKK
jgi:hypothetical protein